MTVLFKAKESKESHRSDAGGSELYRNGIAQVVNQDYSTACRVLPRRVQCIQTLKSRYSPESLSVLA